MAVRELEAASGGVAAADQGTSLFRRHAGFAEADEIFEDTYSVPPIYHYAMEPHAVLAKYEQDSVTVWTFDEPEKLAELLY